MRNLLLVLCMLVLTTGLLTAYSADQISPQLLEKTATYIDDICMQNLRVLQEIAASPAAVEGNWPAIKRSLEEIPDRFPGVWFYVLPDGNYYSLERDYTNLNLRDRGYFQSLFEGESILGFPIYSRSTGKKSAVMAAPIIVQGKVTGAMGLSVYLDELHQEIDNQLEISGDFTWFAINSEGLTMLDTDADYIFMNTLTEAPASMSTSIAAALDQNNGEISYDLGEVKRYGRFRKLPNLDWWLIMARKEPGERESTSHLAISLQRFVPELQKSLDDLASIALAQSNVASSSWNQEAFVRPILKGLIEANQTVIDAAFVDTKGVMRYIEPSLYRNSEGTDITKQAHVKQWMQKASPVLSEAFMAEEGFWAVSLAFPVMDEKGQLQGAISLLIRPDILINGLLKHSDVPPEAELVILETNGRLLYDDDPKEIGLLLFDDPLYREYDSLLKLGKEIVKQASGKGDYVFESRGGSQKTLKSATWDSVKILGTEWRILLAQAQN